MVNQSNNNNELEFDSRTQKKHYAHSMVDLAHKLAEMKYSSMIALPVSEQIIDAIVASKKINSHIARKRHFQFIGKLLLNYDHQAIIDELEAQSKQHEAGLIRTPFLTQWSEHVLQDSEILSQLYATHDHADIQTLRQLIRVTNKKNDKANRRKLFEYIRSLDMQSPLPYV